MKYELSRKKYLYVSPRGFANEYGIYSVATGQMKKAEQLLEKASRDPNFRARWITRKEAERMTAHNRKLYRTGEANSQHPAGATEIVSIADYF